MRTATIGTATMNPGCRREDPWAPWEPSAGDGWDRSKVAHLHRRAGFGVNLAELRRDLADGPEASVRRLLTPAEDPAFRRTEAALREHVGDDDGRLQAWWLYRMLWSPDPLREKMTLFWHDHFATSQRKVRSARAMLQQNQMLRRLGLSSLSELLLAVTGDDAMLVWLDGGQSSKEKPNENYGREFLELFTLGVGHYTEQDVREAARAFTGWRPWPRGERDRFEFRARGHDDGEKTFLGRTGRWGPADVVRITLEHPAAARRLCRALDRFFVGEERAARPEVIEALVRRLRAAGGDLSAVISTILRSRRFHAPEAVRRRIKSPVEWCVGLLRALELSREGVRLPAMAEACARQGQRLFHPPSVKGWDGGRAWLGAAAMIERSNWAADVAYGNEQTGLRAFVATEWADHHGLARDQIVPALIELVHQEALPRAALETIEEAGRGGGDDAIRDALHLIFHCPEAQLC